MPLWDDRARLLIRAVVTFLVLGAAFFILLREGYPDATQKWAYGAIGLVLGYWLR